MNLFSNSFNEGFIIALIIFLCIYLVCIVVLHSLYLRTVSKTLEQIAPHNRSMEPNQVWLAFIPLFVYYYRFAIVNRLSESLSREYAERNLHFPGNGKFGKDVGIAYCACKIASALISFAGLAYLACWITYWVKISGFKKELE